MNILLIIRTLAIIILILAIALMFPALMTIYYQEQNTKETFFILIAVMVTISLLALQWTKKSKNTKLSMRDSFLVVTLTWVVASLFGACPYYFSNAIPSYTDAFFDTMSGFTTTGATILSNIEALPHSLLFWRAQTHWLGGMGIVVLAVAVLPLLGIGGLQLIAAEAPGPTVDRLTPRITSTAKILWMMYIGYTCIETVLLICCGMSWFDAVTHSFATIATGGFSPKNASVGFYNSATIDMIITIFMVLSGISFALQYKILTGQFQEARKNDEYKVYLAIFFTATLIMTYNLQPYYKTYAEAFRYASFQVASILTTTGFATADYEQWPHLSQAIILLLMFFGGCAGSTSGGIKIIRIITVIKQAFNEMKYLLHPRGLFLLTVNDKPIKKDVVYAISGFVSMYITLVLFTTLIVATHNHDITTAFTTALTTIGNIGPGFNSVGPTKNFAFYPAYIKWYLSFIMMVGRLEIYSVLVIFMPIFWQHK